MMNEIINRRSIRKYKDLDVSRKDIAEVLQAGVLAPSSKNRQPWKFIVVSGKAKEEMLVAMDSGLEREKISPLLPGSRQHRKGAEYTRSIMAQAPVTIFIINTLGLDLSARLSPEERICEICNAQSIGAALENMSLTAAHLGLGSLWICDTYFAQRELMEWLDTDGQLIAAMTLGLADEAPPARPRRGLQETIEWRGFEGISER